jgi:polysaccharide biosynthesis protein PslG
MGAAAREVAMRCLVLAAILLGIAALARAAEPLAIGVQTHFAFEPPRTDVRAFRAWMQRSGFTSSRDEMFWWDVEDGSGTLGLRKGALRSQQVWDSMPGPFAALLTLDFGHPGYDAGGQPRTEQGRLAFARYADFAASHSQPRVRWVEIWNEWNLVSDHQRGVGNRGEPEEYVRLARIAYRKLKADHPDLRVLTGSAGDETPEWPWTREAIRRGMLENTDGVAVHLYNYCIPEAVGGSDELADRLDSLHAIISAAGRPQLPIFVTEVGWPTNRGDCGTSEGTAAAQSVRFLLEASLRPWVAGVWFYELQDGGDDPANREHRFGLLRRDGTEKPAGCALRELGAQVARRPFAFMGVNAVVTAGFRNGNTSDRWLLWTRGKTQQAVTVRLESTTGRAASFAAPTVCGLPVADMRVDPQGRFVTMRLSPRTVSVIDVPAGEALRLEQLP